MFGQQAIHFRENAIADPTVLADFWPRAWGSPVPAAYGQVLERSLGHVCAYDGDRLVGFVNLAWDGGVHAFILDTCVDAGYRRQGIATILVQLAVEIARAGGVHWVHVDFEPQLESFYRACGFGPTAAGLMRVGG